MDEAPLNAAIPGFRSLTQAGMHLREGEGVAPNVPDPAEVRVETEALTAAQAASVQRRSRGVAIQPREPGTKRPTPRDAQQQALPMHPQNMAPQGIYMGQMPAIQFSCPCCGVVLTITEPSAYNGQPGPCPGCSAVVMPPQVVSPFALASSNEKPQSSRRHYSGFVV